jgi:hypothetical protein
MPAPDLLIAFVRGRERQSPIPRFLRLGMVGDCTTLLSFRTVATRFFERRF